MPLSLIFSLLLLCLSGCKSKIEFEEIASAEEIFSKASIMLEKKDYKDAAEEFYNVYIQHPGSNLTSKALLLEAYSLFLDKSFQEIPDILDIYIQLYPTSDEISYAYYLKALSYYKQVIAPKYDDTPALKAKAGFEFMLQRFPLTEYAKASEIYLEEMINLLAEKILYISKYYLRNNKPIASVINLQNLLVLYPDSKMSAEAIYRLTESYKVLGIQEQYNKYADLLQTQHPNSYWSSLVDNNNK